MKEGIFRKVGVAALSALTAGTTAGLIPFAAPAGAQTTGGVDCGRIFGGTRFETAIEIAEDTFGTNIPTVLVARGNGTTQNPVGANPDSLSGAPLAGDTGTGAPIILVEDDDIPASVVDALNRWNTQNAVILGGPVAVNDAVEAELNALLDGTVSRVEGPTRYDTAADVASEVGPGTLNGETAVFLANGETFVDALAVSPEAYNAGVPILLTPPNELHDAAAGFIEENNVERVYILGGPVAISSGVEAEVVTLNGATTQATRIQGGTAEATAVEIAQEIAINELGWDLTHFNLANRAQDHLVDSLTGGPHGGEEEGVTLLASGTDTLGTATEDFLEAAAAGNIDDDQNNAVAGPTSCELLGGPLALSDNVEEAAEAAATPDTVTPAGVTARPELVSAQIVSTTQTGQATAANPAGTVVRYVFDEPVGAVQTAALFHLYRFNTPNAPLNADSATRDPNDANAVLARFNSLTNDPNNTAASTADISVATVDFNAIVDGQGLANPEGDAALGSGQQSGTTLTAGRTQAPDLVSLNFRATTATTQTAVDFVFDQAAFVQNAGGTGFHIVLSDLTDLTCTGPSQTTTTGGGGTVAGGNGTTTITVICPNNAAGTSTTPLSASNIARGYVDPDTVGSTPSAGAAATFPGAGGVNCDATNPQGTTNRCNPLEASDTPDNATIAPDLVSVRFVAATTAGGTETVIYTFDQAVATAPAANIARFFVYRNDGSEVAGSAVQNPSGPQISGNEVAVIFPNGTLTGATGGSVEDATVTGAGGQANQEDEAAATSGIQQPSQTTQPAGSTTGPDLVSVALQQGGTFGNQFVATYTFDEAISVAPGGAIAADNSFRLYTSTGAILVATNCVAGSATSGATTTNSVVCNAYDTAAGTGNTPSGTAATNATIGSAVLGTVDNAAVADAAGNQNPEGASATTGGTGTPA